MKNITTGEKTMKKLSMILALAAFAGSASAAVVTYDGNGVGTLTAYEDTVNWDPEAVGTSADDATVTARFRINDGVDYFLNSLVTVGGNGSSSFISNGSLDVTGLATLNNGLAVQGNGNLVVGGLMTLGDGVGTDTLSLTFGTHTDPSKVVGNDLDVSSSGVIELRWFTSATEGSTVPDIDLSGALDFAAGSEVAITLEGGTLPRALAHGSYFLVGSDNISGTLPTLDVSSGWTTAQAANSSLSFVTSGGNQGLYLNVSSVPEPSTLGLLGFGALIMLYIRRMRA